MKVNLKDNTIKLIVKGIIAKQSLSVNVCFENGIFKYADITNLYFYIDRQGNVLDENIVEVAKQGPSFKKDYLERVKITYGWYFVHDWLADHLDHMKQPILSNGYGAWWGPTQYTKDLFENLILQQITEKINARSIIG